MGWHMDYGCTECNCPNFLSREPGLYEIGNPSMADGWVIRPSRKCTCGHKGKVHTILRESRGDHGAIATFFSSDGMIQIIHSFGLHSREEAEEDALTRCMQACADVGGYDSAVRIWGSQGYLAVAQANDGRIGWGSAPYFRNHAERYAVKACRDRKPRGVFSMDPKFGSHHLHVGGEYCSKRLG
jgi:Domain of unknown function (DUF4189)